MVLHTYCIQCNGDLFSLKISAKGWRPGVGKFWVFLGLIFQGGLGFKKKIRLQRAVRGFLKNFACSGAFDGYI